MIYSTDKKREIDNIIAAFHDYIQAHTYFDILYSEKIGYIRVKTEDPVDGEAHSNSISG